MQNLSESVKALPKHHAERQGYFCVDDWNRELYRELARARLMGVGHSFVGGRESFHRLAQIVRKGATAQWLSESTARFQ